MNYMNYMDAHVIRGAKWLDENYAGWFDKIDADKLMMFQPSRCVLGQLFWKESMGIGYSAWMQVLGAAGMDRNEARNLGFEDFTKEWKAYILDRQAVSRMGSAPVIEQEPVLERRYILNLEDDCILRGLDWDQVTYLMDLANKAGRTATVEN